MFVLCSSGVVSPSSASGERASETSPILSGLYSYHISTNTWTKLRDNQLEPQPKLGQSMIFHPVCMHYLWSCFFYSTWFNPGIYLAVVFYHPGKKIAQFSYPVGRKRAARYMPGLARIKPGRIKKTRPLLQVL